MIPGVLASTSSAEPRALDVHLQTLACQLGLGQMAGDHHLAQHLGVLLQLDGEPGNRRHAEVLRHIAHARHPQHAAAFVGDEGEQAVLVRHRALHEGRIGQRQ